MCIQNKIDDKTSSVNNLMSFGKNQLDVFLTRFFHNLALYQNVKQCIIDNDRELLLTQTNRLKQTLFYQVSQ